MSFAVSVLLSNLKKSISCKFILVSTFFLTLSPTALGSDIGEYEHFFDENWNPVADYCRSYNVQFSHWGDSAINIDSCSLDERALLSAIRSNNIVAIDRLISAESVDLTREYSMAKTGFGFDLFQWAVFHLNTFTLSKLLTVERTWPHLNREVRDLRSIRNFPDCSSGGSTINWSGYLLSFNECERKNSDKDTISQIRQMLMNSPAVEFPQLVHWAKLIVIYKELDHDIYLLRQSPNFDINKYFPCDRGMDAPYEQSSCLLLHETITKYNDEGEEYKDAVFKLLRFPDVNPSLKSYAWEYENYLSALDLAARFKLNNLVTHLLSNFDLTSVKNSGFVSAIYGLNQVALEQMLDHFGDGIINTVHYTGTTPLQNALFVFLSEVESSFYRDPSRLKASRDIFELLFTHPVTDLNLRPRPNGRANIGFICERGKNGLIATLFSCFHSSYGKSLVHLKKVVLRVFTRIIANNDFRFKSFESEIVMRSIFHLNSVDLLNQALLRAEEIDITAEFKWKPKGFFRDFSFNALEWSIHFEKDDLVKALVATGRFPNNPRPIPW